MKKIAGCPNCHKKVSKGKIYCDNPVCKMEVKSRKHIEIYKRIKKTPCS